MLFSSKHFFFLHMFVLVLVHEEAEQSQGFEVSHSLKANRNDGAKFFPVLYTNRGMLKAFIGTMDQTSGQNFRINILVLHLSDNITQPNAVAQVQIQLTIWFYSFSPHLEVLMIRPIFPANRKIQNTDCIQTSPISVSEDQRVFTLTPNWT